MGLLPARPAPSLAERSTTAIKSSILGCGLSPPHPGAASSSPSEPMQRVPKLIASIILVGATPALADDVRFNRDIRPIFSENCFACHGPDRNARQADLRLDRREAALARGAIVPGEPAASKLLQRVRNTNEVLRMPPVYAGKTLTEEQQNLLARWVEQGAEYEAHWAYLPPVRPAAPDGPAAIDFLIGKMLDARNLQPVGSADLRTLARRLSFDLTGLPPGADLVAAFESDNSADAYGRLVDQLLGSQHFGERLAVHWLDLVRYADTVGFHGDVAVNVYPYRDYVIRSFNENKPFDEFTREQLGGDLIPDATLDQRVASAYNRLGRMTNEGGSQAQEYLAKYASDRARTVSTVWLASTMGCAECHDHKFDPFTAKDFYAMQAFFADIEEEGVFAGYGDWGANVLVPSSEAREELRQIESRIEELRSAGQDPPPPDTWLVDGFALELRRNLARWQVLEPASVTNDCSDPDIWDCEKFEVIAERGGFVSSRFTQGAKPGKLAQIVESKLGDQRITALLLEMFPPEDCESFFLGELAIRWQRPGEEPREAPIETFLPDWEDEGSRLQRLGDGNHHTGWAGNPHEEGVRRAIFVLQTPIDARAGDTLLVESVYDQIFGVHGLAYRQRLAVTDADKFEFPVPERVAKLLALDAWDKAQQETMERFYQKQTGGSPHWQEIRSLERRRKTLLDHADETLVTKSVEPRTIRVLPRGNWMDTSGEVVEPQAPHFLAPIPSEGRRLNRLDLADWLVDRGNPLTARVMVNRLWRLFFGTGLSKVLDDLGSQGEPPVSQELLDWLAVEFMDSGWNVKHIVRTMLLSDTYKRSSEPTAELLAADPGNRLHGRQTPTRLDAEFIRDNALLVSGLLNPEVGGRSSKPYQPANHYKELNFPKREYQADVDENQYRRGLYTHWQRTYLHPSMKAFDAPSREECAADRASSNTPLQSLVLLNDPTFVEAAKAFAVRILESDTNGSQGRLDYAFREALSRAATPDERKVLTGFLARQLAHYRENPNQADALLGTGLYEVSSTLERTEAAAWTSVARAILNKHEFVMRY